MRHERPTDHPDTGPDEVGAEAERGVRPRANPIGLMVVEEHRVSLLGVRRLLHEADVEVADAATALDLAARRQPHVILMDLTLGPASVVQAITTSAPDTRVVVLARSADDPGILPALAAGACGCVVGRAPIGEILDAVRAAARGESTVSASVAGQLVRQVRDHPVDGFLTAARLTPRELEVLRLLARGWDNAQIGQTLYLSRGTVKHHISSILSKLQVENRIQAAVQAVRGGLLDG